MKDDEERIDPTGDVSAKAPQATHTRIRRGRRCEGGGGTLGHWEHAEWGLGRPAVGSHQCTPGHTGADQGTRV